MNHHHTITPRRDPQIVAFTGLAGSGKDASADHLVEHYGFVRAAFAEALKDMAAHLLDEASVDYSHLFERHLKEKPIAMLHGVSGRQIMQTLGDWGRALHADWWITILARRLGLDGGPDSAPVHDRIVITDVRMPNEAAWVLQHGGLLVRLHREQAGPVRAHDSDAVHRLPASLNLGNNGPTLVG
ncbi:hypothetical protein, partial [Acidovorax sp.]|uniref:hypothetical protein n=1 Tax=Acidovorax sp. TaxID=1872122 RepID=UPI0025891EC5